MTRQEENARRLSKALADRAEDTAFINRLAVLLDYDWEQLNTDIRANYDELRRKKE